jgi:recombination protein RecR
MSLPESIQNLIDEFSKLPGIGSKTASRLVFYLLNKSDQEVAGFSQAVANLSKGLQKCQICFNVSEDNPCNICNNSKRDKSKIMVVEEPLDVVAIEKTPYDGLFHVLGGAISPIDNIGPDDLRIKELIDRIKTEKGISEIILATDPSLEGEATAMYITKQIKNQNIENRIKSNIIVTRIARGLPVGGDLEYADEITLTRALEGRKEYD